MLSFNAGDCFSEGYSEMSLIVLILGPLTFIFILINLRARFVLSSSQVHFFFFLIIREMEHFFSEFENYKLCQSGIVDLTVAKKMEKDPVLACFMFCELPFYLSDAECPHFLWRLRWPPDLCKANRRKKTKQSAGIGEIFFCSPTMGIEQFDGTLKKRQKDWDVLYYMLTKHTRTNMYTVIHKFKC